MPYVGLLRITSMMSYRRKSRCGGIRGEKKPLQRSLACPIASFQETSSADHYNGYFLQSIYILDTMDGISSASAVVSLTVQLISTTRDIINFLREIKDSPEELRFTIESLDQLHGICEVAKSGLETRIENVDLPPPLVLVSNALKICESKIRLVELCVTKFKLVLDGQSRVRKKWASFKHVLKKGEIQRLQDQLDRATRYLELTLVLNVLQ